MEIIKLKFSDLEQLVINKPNLQELIEYIRPYENDYMERPLDERVGPDINSESATLRSIIAEALGVDSDSEEVTDWIESHKK